jgi:thioredoxin 1
MKQIIFIILSLLFINGCSSTRVEKNSGAVLAVFSEIKEIEEKDFEKEVLQEDKLVIVDFWALWCAPCKKQGVILIDVAEKNKNIKFVKIDYDNSNNLNNKYKIKMIPTLLFFKNGKLVASLIGLKSKEDIQSFIDKHR